MLKEIKTNNKGYVNFEKRNFSFAGDRRSWAMIKDGKLIVKRAAKGIISDDYNNEMWEFCYQNGIDWNQIACGSFISIDI